MRPFINPNFLESPKKRNNRSNYRARTGATQIDGGSPIMSESLATPAMSVARCNGASELRMLAQVEKWMATIREIAREQQGVAKMPAVG